MLKKIEKFITSLGDFNHLAVVLLVQVIITGILYITGAFSLAPSAAAILGFGFSMFYYGKEHWTYIRLGELASLNPNNWQPHDRKQTIYVWLSAIVYPIILSVI